MLGLDPRDHIREHAAKNLPGGILTNEIEDDDIVADAVENLRPRQAKLEVVLDGGSDLRLDHIVWILGSDVLDSFAVLVLDEYSEIRCENDDRFGKIDGVSAAIDHINKYSSAHTEAIITEDYTAAMRFLREVDSSSVMVNASTRFADGFEYGLGAEIGISTDKFHARGPVGLEGLTSQKWIVLGNGEVRS